MLNWRGFGFSRVHVGVDLQNCFRNSNLGENLTGNISYEIDLQTKKFKNHGYRSG